MLILEKLTQKERMTATEASLSDYFINAGRELKHKSSRAIANELYIAPSTVSRFCQQIGYAGFNAFKEAYLKELDYLERTSQQVDPNRPFTAKDRNKALANKLATLYKDTVEDSLDLLEHDSLQKATCLLLEPQHIIIGAAGDPLEMAETFKNRMLKIGKSVQVERRGDNLFFQAKTAPKTTCFILLSYSGELEQLLKTADVLRRRKLPFFALTSYGDNQLTRLADLTLHLSTREKLVDNLGNFSSLLSLSFVLDVLYANVFAHQYDSHYSNRMELSRGYEKKRKSDNPIINAFLK
ncbi:DNA-binding MurR/RpiR family transcriptional regulator [Streptococcus rupicaprae]|uniref:DNA-binding MurR/RpiR family transcriptional regulator n=1 Tax=Streptococcus rupicaprae TaxID=759619 RepID=A0ABV2FHW7_9STRE